MIVGFNVHMPSLVGTESAIQRREEKTGKQLLASMIPKVR